jgi:hypothetical protein
MNNPTTQEILGTERRQINMAETKEEKKQKNVLAKVRQFLILVRHRRDTRIVQSSQSFISETEIKENKST